MSSESTYGTLSIICCARVFPTHHLVLFAYSKTEIISTYATFPYLFLPYRVCITYPFPLNFKFEWDLKLIDNCKIKFGGLGAWMRSCISLFFFAKIHSLADTAHMAKSKKHLTVLNIYGCLRLFAMPWITSTRVICKLNHWFWLKALKQMVPKCKALLLYTKP